MHSQKLSLNSLYCSAHAACSQKLSLSANSTHLAFSREIMGADILEKLSLKLSFIVPCVAKNSLYRSARATRRRKLSLSANSIHLVFSRKICGGCHIGKNSLYNSLYRSVHAACSQKLSLNGKKVSENKNQLSLRTKQF